MGVVNYITNEEVILMSYHCGEKPGKGRYVCLNCGEDLYLDDNTDTLPPCAKCEKCDFRKG